MNQSYLFSCTHCKKNDNPNLQATKIAITEISASIKSSSIKNSQREINQVRYEIKKRFAKSWNDFWSNKTKQENYRDSDNSFPNINRICRPTKKLIINILKIDTDLVQRIGLDYYNFQKSDGYIIINEQSQILNALRAHFEQSTKRLLPRRISECTPLSMTTKTCWRPK